MSHYFTNDNNLKSEYRNILYNYEDFSLEFISDLGVFSKDRVDYASKLLVESFLKVEKNCNSILDVGCGYGFIGITISKIMNSFVDMIDVNKRAVHLADLNIKKNKVKAKSFISDCYSNIEKKYDVIISNPPIRAGKEIYMKIILNAINYLNDGGRLWFVMNKDQGAKSTIEKIKNIYNVEVVKKSKGFFVIICKKR